MRSTDPGHEGEMPPERKFRSLGAGQSAHRPEDMDTLNQWLRQSDRVTARKRRNERIRREAENKASVDMRIAHGIATATAIIIAVFLLSIAVIFLVKVAMFWWSIL